MQKLQVQSPHVLNIAASHRETLTYLLKNSWKSEIWRAEWVQEDKAIVAAGTAVWATADCKTAPCQRHQHWALKWAKHSMISANSSHQKHSPVPQGPYEANKNSFPQIAPAAELPLRTMHCQQPPRRKISPLEAAIILLPGHFSRAFHAHWKLQILQFSALVTCSRQKGTVPLRCRHLLSPLVLPHGAAHTSVTLSPAFLWVTRGSHWAQRSLESHKGNTEPSIPRGAAAPPFSTATSDVPHLLPQPGFALNISLLPISTTSMYRSTSAQADAFFPVARHCQSVTYTWSTSSLISVW